MAWKTPVVSGGLLRVPLTGDVIAVDSGTWYTWLDDEAHSSFHFVHAAGDFTVRKERKQRGQFYWVAYRHVHGKIFKAYLGKSAALNESLLCATAQTLARAVQNGSNDAS